MADENTGAGQILIGETACHSVAELAMAMAENPEAAAGLIDQGAVQQWLEAKAQAPEAKADLDELLSTYIGERALFEFALRHAPDWSPKIDGVSVEPDQLTRHFSDCLRDDHIVRDRSLSELAHKVYGWDVLTDERITKGDDRLAQIDQLLAKQFVHALKARGETLRYVGFYAVAGDSSQQYLLPNRQVELAFAERTANDSEESLADFADAANLTVHPWQADLLAELLAAKDLSEPFRSTYKVEDMPEFAEARKRPWFNELLKLYPDRDAGQEVALRDAAVVAASQVQALAKARQRKAGKPPASTAEVAERIDQWMSWPLSQLSRPMQAAVFGIATFVVLLTFTGSEIDWMTYLHIGVMGMAFGMIPARLISFGNWRFVISIVLAAVIGVFLIGYFDRELWESSFFYEALFGIAAAVSGYYREPMLAIREKSRQSAGPNGQALSSKKQMPMQQLRTKFFPELLQSIPRDQWSSEDRALVAAIEHDVVAEMGLAQHVDRRSFASPNNKNGVSFSMGGSNIHADGATFQVVDGISMDNLGNWNARVLDGLTLHNDGQMTTRVTKGVEVRTDGQVSVEAGGARFSFGGKDKKKKEDEWDWGTGQKKEKGWFD